MDRVNTIIHILRDLGTPCNIRGYYFIKQAVSMILEDRKYLDLITMALYPDIAKSNNTTSSRVERAIRHAIEVTFNNIQPDIQKKYFGNTVNARTGKPTNALFLATIAECAENTEVSQ